MNRDTQNICHYYRKPGKLSNLNEKVKITLLKSDLKLKSKSSVKISVKLTISINIPMHPGNCFPLQYVTVYFQPYLVHSSLNRNIDNEWCKFEFY